MATKILDTRIRNKVDTFNNWSAPGVTLLPGEIAFVSVVTQQIDEDTGNIINVPAVLMKVGEAAADGGTKAFSDLPWLSAKAADVYDWAKNANAENIPVSILLGDTTEEKTLGSWLFSLLNDIATNIASITSLNSTVAANKADIEKELKTLKDSVAGGVHFIGITTSDISDGDMGTTPVVLVDGSTHIPMSGDVVIKGNKEYIFNGFRWNELGDLSRVGALETWRAQLICSTPPVDGTAVEFIDSVTQLDGIVVVSKKSIRTASTSAAGIVQLSSSIGTDSESLAATAKAVKTVYDKGVDVQNRVETIENNYIRVNQSDQTLCMGKETIDTIIFDCCI